MSNMTGFISWCCCATTANSQIKKSGFRGFSMLGKEKVAGEFSLVCCATHNFKQNAKATITGLIRPEF